jgi:hypothetical protein
VIDQGAPGPGAGSAGREEGDDRCSSTIAVGAYLIQDASLTVEEDLAHVIGPAVTAQASAERGVHGCGEEDGMLPERRWDQAEGLQAAAFHPVD